MVHRQVLVLVVARQALPVAVPVVPLLVLARALVLLILIAITRMKDSTVQKIVPNSVDHLISIGLVLP